MKAAPKPATSKLPESSSDDKDDIQPTSKHSRKPVKPTLAKKSEATARQTTQTERERFTRAKSKSTPSASSNEDQRPHPPSANTRRASSRQSIRQDGADATETKKRAREPEADDFPDLFAFTPAPKKRSTISRPQIELRDESFSVNDRSTEVDDEARPNYGRKPGAHRAALPATLPASRPRSSATRPDKTYIFAPPLPETATLDAHFAHIATEMLRRYGDLTDEQIALHAAKHAPYKAVLQQLAESSWRVKLLGAVPRMDHLVKVGLRTYRLPNA